MKASAGYRATPAGRSWRGETSASTIPQAKSITYVFKMHLSMVVGFTGLSGLPR